MADDPTDRDAVDDALVAALDDAFGADPVPAALSRFAVEAFSWRVVDDELAAIAFDSATADLVGIRGSTAQRHTVRFEGREISVSIVLSATSLVATIEPAAAYRCTLEGPAGSIRETTDDGGQLAIDIPSLPMRLVVEGPSGRLVTPWITG